MSDTFFKDIYAYLSNLYPNTKVYVASDHHFFHDNIILYERPEFDTTYEMNEFIIKNHNKIVKDNDIVIFLGDFCFKHTETKNIVSRMNGHKFLLLGNHDNADYYQKKYNEYGFENIFMYPVQFNNYYLSHYPLYEGYPNDVIYNIFNKDFNRNDNINIHGHIHSQEKDYPKSINVCLENKDYKPYLIGRTAQKEKNNDLVNSNDFNMILEFLTSKKNMDLNALISDYFYTSILELSEDFNNVFFYGSFTLNQKFGLKGPFSDLDASIIYDPKKSKNANESSLKEYSDYIYLCLKNNNNFNIGFDKKMCNINILTSAYLSKNSKPIHTYLDVNLINHEVYKPEDFMTFSGSSLLENYTNKYFPELTQKYHFPKYETLCLNTTGDLANLLLQYLYQISYPEKKKKVLQKMAFILNNCPEKISELANNFEDTLIRFLIKNILFFKYTSRKDEIKALKDIDINIKKINTFCNSEFYNLTENILLDPNSEYNKVFDIISNTKYKDSEKVCKELLKEKRNNC